MGRGVTWTPPARRERASPWPFVGVGGLACSLFLILGSVYLWPWWGTLVLMMVWLAGFVLVTRWWTPHPVRVVLVPLAVASCWVVAVVLAATT